MKKFMQKNLPFLSILIIIALFAAPIILATTFTGIGDVSSFTGFGDVSSFIGFGDVSGFTGLGDASFTGLGDGQTTGADEGTTDQPEEQPADEDTGGPFDPIFDPGTQPPTGGGDVPPLDDAFEATIDISLSDSPDPVQPGDEIAYTITYYNTGNGDARDIVITMDADPDAPIQSSEPSATTGNYEWRLDEVKSKTGGTITIKAQVKDKAEDGQTLASKAAITYRDPVYGDKTTSDTEYTKVKAIGDDEEPEPEPSEDETIGISILSARFPLQSAAGEPVLMTISIKNSGTEDLEAVKITVTDQELGIKTSAGPFDLDSGESATKTLVMDIPADAPEGNYFLRFTITSNGNTRRTIYRDIDLVATLE